MEYFDNQIEKYFSDELIFYTIFGGIVRLNGLFFGEISH